MLAKDTFGSTEAITITVPLVLLIKGRHETDSNPALQKLYLNTSLPYRKIKIPMVFCTALIK